jgi:hypothetical protein
MSSYAANHLDSLNVDELKKLASVICPGQKLTRKADLISSLSDTLANVDVLRQLWEQLDDTQKMAVSEGVYSARRAIDPTKFKAKYGQLPDMGARDWGFRYGRNPHSPPPILRFFFPAGYIPEDIRKLLLTFVPKPPQNALQTLDELPDISIIARNTACGALQDLLTMLHLIDSGKLLVSDKTLRPSRTAMDTISANLTDGDLYDLQSGDANPDRQIGHIKAFAWPLLLQAANFVQAKPSRLALTSAGLRARSSSRHEMIRQIWDCWLGSRFFDEFQRIEAVKGQTGKGRKSMTPVAGRRAAIVEGLKQCPPNRWVRVTELSRFMQAEGINFLVSDNPWSLYISDPQYGSLGYDGSNEWNIIEGRYINCFLLEYAATLGLIDIGYIRPDDAGNDYGHMWGTDDLPFLSRYDGLLYFRLNDLGAYCLGLTERYESLQPQTLTSMTVFPGLNITWLPGSDALEIGLLLDSYAQREAENVWRLDRHKAVQAVERGHEIAQLRDLLQSRDEQPLPETVEAFITNSQRHGRALQNMGTAIVIACINAELAEMIANHKSTKHLCQRPGEKDLVVLTSKEDLFHKAVNILGYGMPKI